jgi:hypothetical protein
MRVLVNLSFIFALETVVLKKSINFIQKRIAIQIWGNLYGLLQKRKYKYDADAVRDVLDV